jgi:hypothetical protein
MKVCAESVVIGNKRRRFPTNGCATPLRMADSSIFEAILACHRVHPSPTAATPPCGGKCGLTFFHGYYEQYRSSCQRNRFVV